KGWDPHFLKIKRGCEEMNPHFFTAPFYFAFIWFRVQGSRLSWRLRRLFLEDGILVSPFLVSLIACAIIQKGIMRNGD
ncbi:MAG: hypothetical protein SOY71_00795, partial [Dialister sp.]|nr:hypothetical protein [Dialister sp.]